MNMKLSKRAIAVGSLAALLTVGAAGVVAAAGVNGQGPASVLSNLVNDGTLTQEQADKVADAFKQEHEQRHQEMEARRAETEKVITDTLGISADDLKTAREEGKSLADLAGDKRDELVAALVAAENAQIDQGVADGKLTQEQADEMKSQTQQRVEDRVDGKHPEGGPGGRNGGPGGHGGRGMGFGGPGGPGDDAEGSTNNDSTTQSSSTSA